MMHRFKTGQRVRLRTDRVLLSSGSGTYKIIAALPIERTGEIRYRIKSDAETFERVAEEETLSPTV